MSSQRAQFAATAQKPRLNLPAARDRAGLSLSQIAESTKISSRFLRAVEEEAFSDLPGGIFNTSYIRQYAAAIGVDSDEILKVYYESLPDAVAGEAGGSAQPGKEAPKAGLLRWFGLSTATSRF